MTINAATGLVTWLPNVFQTGSNAVTVLATDQFGGRAHQTFSINVPGGFIFPDPFGPTKWSLVTVGPVYGIAR